MHRMPRFEAFVAFGRCGSINRAHTVAAGGLDSCRTDKSAMASSVRVRADYEALPQQLCGVILACLRRYMVRTNSQCCRLMTMRSAALSTPSSPHAHKHTSQHTPARQVPPRNLHAAPGAQRSGAMPAKPFTRAEPSTHWQAASPRKEQQLSQQRKPAGVEGALDGTCSVNRHPGCPASAPARSAV